MAKIYGLFGAMTGKLSDVVMVVRNGVQIARKYQPQVTNPSSPAQVAQRAKLKALSQLSAILAPAIAMYRQGSRSRRNIFVKENFSSVTFSNNTATINIPSVKITASAVGLPQITATNNAGVLSLSLAVAPTGLNRIVYVVIIRDNDNHLRFDGSVVVEEAGADGRFSTQYSMSGAPDAFVLAYGIRDNTDTARSIFGDLENANASTIATLIVNRTLTESDITLTETRGVTAFIQS